MEIIEIYWGNNVSRIDVIHTTRKLLEINWKTNNSNICDSRSLKIIENLMENNESRKVINHTMRKLLKIN